MQLQRFGGDENRRVKIDNIRPKNMQFEKEITTQMRKQTQ
jgi:hypothetical protein